ncbi:MAG: PQQ-binding-like beta-propeller repeat protein [Verrucomicrobiales bacterium]
MGECADDEVMGWGMAWRRLGATCLVGLVGVGWAAGQGVVDPPPLTAEKFEERSLALRTALFHDPSLDAPLQSLLELYRKAGREDELLGLYRSHMAQYPDDSGSNAVLVRLLLEMKRPEATAVAAAAVDAHPKDPLILYLRFSDLQRQRDPRALEALTQAIEAESDALRKAEWTDELVRAALAEDRRDLAEAALRTLVTGPAPSMVHRAALVQRLNRDEFPELALEAATAALKDGPSPELGVEFELQAAGAEAALDLVGEASARLDRLLTRVASDYVRRSEIVARRVALLRTDAERSAHLKLARDGWTAAPESESAALDLAELLVACELRREALDVLRTATGRLTGSLRLEKATLDLLERLGDERGMRDFLRDRLAAQPERSDLAARLVGALYALGESTAAAAQFDSLLTGLPPDEQVRRRLDLARALRRMTLPKEAAAQLEEVLAADPKRLDVRRELAEALLASNDPEGARRLMREAMAPDAAIENFLDVVAFMMGPESSATWPEARDALRGRLALEPRNFEVAMLLVDVLGRLGEQAEGEAVLEQARGLADTDARYRRWIEVGLALAEAAGGAEGFFDAEQARLVAAVDEATGGWTPERAAQYLLFCEVTKQAEVEPQLIASLKARLDDPATPVELRVPLRRLLVEALRRDPTQSVEVQNHLQVLAGEDVARADEYRLRLARAGHESAQRDGGRPDQVRVLLQSIDVEKIDDPVLLRGAHMLFLDYGYSGSALTVLERLTQLEPGDAGHWERWISALALQGEEERLREALRQVLSGVTAEPLAAETLELLRGHLVDSCWRSVARLFANDEAERLPEVLPLLETIERLRSSSPEQLWVTWTRGHALRQAGHVEAAAAAASELESLASRWHAEKGEPPQLLFPDGLILSLEHGLRLLRDASPASSGLAESPTGPDRAPAMQWGFVTDGGSVIVQVEPLGEGAGAGVAVLDQAGTVYVLDAATGKLRWRHPGLWEAGSSAPTPIARGRRMRSAAGFFGQDGNIPIRVMPRLAVDEAGGRLVVSRDGEISTLSTEDGGVVWRASLPGVSRRVPPQPGLMPLPPLADEVLIDEAGRVLLWRAESAMAAAFHPRTGKLLWEREVALESPPPMLGPLNAGASCDGARLLVYGHRPCVLETATGAILWGFGGETVREFPVALKSESSVASSPGAAAALPMPVSMPGRGGYLPGSAGGVGPRRISLNYLRPLADRASVLGQWMAGKGVLVAPAVAWAEQNWQPIGGELARGRLILMMPGLSLAPSMDLPLGGARLDATPGTWLGVTGGRAVFLNDQALTLFDLVRGGSTAVPLAAIAAPSGEARVATTPPFFAVEGTVAGSRVFVTGPGGLMAVNPWTGRVLFAEGWPEAVRQFAGLVPPEAATESDPSALAAAQARGVQFTPRYVLHSSPTANLGLRPRHAARGQWLFAVLGADRLVGLAAQ